MIACDESGCRLEGAVTVENAARLLRELKPNLEQLRLSGLPANIMTLAELYGVAELLPA